MLIMIVVLKVVFVLIFAAEAVGKEEGSTVLGKLSIVRERPQTSLR